MPNTHHAFTITYNETIEEIKNATAQAVFRSLCSFRNAKTGLCCPSINKISERCSLNKRTVIRLLKYLCDIEVLKINKKKGSENMYSINGYKNSNVTSYKNVTSGSDKMSLGSDKLCTSIRSINYIINNKTSSLAPPIENKNVEVDKNKNTEEEEFFLFYKGILEEYNKILGSKLLRADLTPTIPRMEAVKKCVKVLNSLSKWNKLFNQILKTSFLCGYGKKGFKADLDWIIDDKHFIKIHEGRYETNKEKANILMVELIEMIRERRAYRSCY